MKKMMAVILTVLLSAAVVSCSSKEVEGVMQNVSSADVVSTITDTPDGTAITLKESDTQISGAGAQADGADVTISSAGTYNISGETTDGTVTVDAPGGEVVLILNGVSIKSASGPAILIKDAGSVTVTLADGTVNTLEDAGESNYDGALYGCISYTINGEGTLVVNGTAEEGIASEMHLTIESGTIEITASDDGINANNDGVSEIIINGGTIYINAGGDGIDSNGSIEMNGGTVVTFGAVNDANGGLDADSGITMNGGTVLATGANISTPSGGAQKYIVASVNGQAGDTVSIGANGAELFSAELAQTCRMILYSSPDIEEGAVYDVSLNGTVQASVTTDDVNAAGGPGGGKQPMPMN
ncbi:carbohydrate-binding domain-containing protein [Christensenella timonensis]|uniref:carbohydrate-binding domain-containing protein n=1 Tax=Christensenella timonensis TaxID=1816678 RepID=UPI000836FE79|nr:carbohydrate-binding domain-containing protein [Christensenella timonensis]